MSKITASAAGTITFGDLTVNRMGFGAMRLPGRGIWGEPRDPEGARRVLRRAVELDVNFIDTADSYGPEVSERLIREALWPYPAGLVIATKGGLLRDGPDLWRPDGRPSHLRQALEGSLKRLGLERIDLYQFHRPDPDVPYEESVGELVRLQDEGKIRHIGVSNVNEEQLDRALALTEVVSVQNRYNLSDRASEGVLEQCESWGMAFLPWHPLAASQLTRAGNRLAEVASGRGATPGQLALAWLLARSPVMLPIPGTSSVDHLEENIAAAAIKLSPRDVQLLAAALVSA
jgi:aryl-alcohol dehydrogenase-like predicted oxidoreductase